MKQLLFGILTLSVSLVALPSWCGTFSGSLEALYWKPDNGGYDYAATGQFVEPGQVSHVRTLRPDYDWGVRAGVRHLSPSGCSFATFSGLWIRGTDRVSKPFPTRSTRPAYIQDQTSFVKARLRPQYWNLDFQMGQYLVRDARTSLYAVGGVRFGSLRYDQRTESAGDDDSRADLSTRFDGVGPEVGLGGEFCIWSGIRFVGSAAAAAVVGERRNSFTSLTGPDPLTFRFPRTTVIAPEAILRWGFRYTHECRCFSFSGEIGYEMDHYWNAISFLPPLSDNFIQRRERDIGWAGWYFGLSASF